MPLTSSQLHDLCVELRFIGKIGEDEKVHVSTKSLQPASSYYTSFVRTVTRETHSGTIKYVHDKVNRAIEYCEQLSLELADPDRKDAFKTILDDLEACISANRGIDALRSTYVQRPATASELEVIMRDIRLKVDKYRLLIGS